MTELDITEFWIEPLLPWGCESDMNWLSFTVPLLTFPLPPQRLAAEAFTHFAHAAPGMAPAWLAMPVPSKGRPLACRKGRYGTCASQEPSQANSACQLALVLLDSFTRLLGLAGSGFRAGCFRRRGGSSRFTSRGLCGGLFRKFCRSLIGPRRI